ncbi:MAG TPA: MMPL family transporter, partial [Actinopolymorphaceae bacterium]
SVFSGFVFSEAVMVRPIGFGLAFGVLVDAFVVRMLVVPGLLHLVGSAAWWLPRWAQRIMPDIDIEGAALERRHGAGGSGSVKGSDGTAEPTDQPSENVPVQRS